jgi:membrane protease YdiL (CAAX protease family)
MTMPRPNRVALAQPSHPITEPAKKRAPQKIVEIPTTREILFEQVQVKHQQLMRARAAHAELCTLMSFAVLSLCSYVMLTAWISKVAKLNMAPRGPAALGISIGTVLILAVLMIVYVCRYQVTPEQLGLRLTHWRRSILEGLAAAAVLFPSLLLLKSMLVLYDPDFHGKPVLNWTEWDHWLALYVLVAPAQELLTRGFLQGSIERLLPGKQSPALAILVASALFGCMHLHYSFRMAAIATIGSVILGWMFSKRRTLIAVSIAHFILGALIIGPLQLMLD